MVVIEVGCIDVMLSRVEAVGLVDSMLECGFMCLHAT